MFTLTEEQKTKAGKFRNSHDCTIGNNHGAIGGAITYSFTPTSIGIAEKVSCACGKDLDLTDYDLW